MTGPVSSQSLLLPQKKTSVPIKIEVFSHLDRNKWSGHGIHRVVRYVAEGIPVCVIDQLV
jgi:hypothetical protein